MNKLIKSALLATTLAIGAHAAVADDLVRENRTVDANVVKVRLGGVIRLNLHQGPTPSLVVSGDRRYVAKVTTTQRGDTLVIDMETIAVSTATARTSCAPISPCRTCRNSCRRVSVRARSPVSAATS